MAWKEKLSNLAGVESQGTELAGFALDWIHLTIDSAETLASVVKETNQLGAKILTRPYCQNDRVLESWASQRDGSEKIIFLNLEKMDRIVEHVVEDQVISCQTGLKVETLNKHLAETGQWLPACGEKPDSTLLNLLESGRSGPLDTGFGGPRNLILGSGLVSGSAVSIKTGGKIVKNVTGYDLTKLLVGSRSWLGIAHTVHLRLFAKPEEIITLVTNIENAHDLKQVLSEITRSGLPVVALDVVDSKLARAILDTHHNRYQNIWKKILELETDSADSCFIVTSIAGQKAEVANTSKVLRSLVSNSARPVVELNTDSSMALFESIGQIEFLTAKKCLSTSLPATVGYALFEKLKDRENSITWLARPSLSMFDFWLEGDCLDDMHDLKEKVLKTLDEIEFAPYLKSSLTVSYPLKDSEYVVDRDNEKLSQIISGIKHKFDKNEIFNPLVKY